MKFKFSILLIVICLTGCSKDKLTNKDITKRYFDARNTTEYEQVKELISDSLIIIEGDYIMPYSQESFYEVFRWDSVFQTSYKIVELKEIDEQIIASIGMSSIRNRFLQNDHMTCQFKLLFKAARISKIESLDCENANWEVWQKRVNDLVEWIKINHPELNGFIHDMTMTGANNYLKAIELYETNIDDK